MFASESGIAILGVVEASATELFDVAAADAGPFHTSDHASENFRHAGLPPPLLTASPKFVAAMARGVEAVRLYLSDVLHHMNDRRLQSLLSALEGASHNG